MRARVVEMTDPFPPRVVAAWRPPVTPEECAGLSLERAKAYHASLVARIAELQEELRVLYEAEQAGALPHHEVAIRTSKRVASIRGLESSARLVKQHIRALDPRTEAYEELERRYADRCAAVRTQRGQLYAAWVLLHELRGAVTPAQQAAIDQVLPPGFEPGAPDAPADGAAS